MSMKKKSMKSVSWDGVARRGLLIVIGKWWSGMSARLCVSLFSLFTLFCCPPILDFI